MDPSDETRAHTTDHGEGAIGSAGSPAPGVAARCLAALGPGILFAGAAIGVSHLVQSTRAGAVYGLSLVGLVLLAHAMKLPAMVFGPRYAAATGTSLLQGYRRQGIHALIVFAIITLGTMFTIQAAVTIVTASIVKGVVLVPLGVDPPLWVVSVGILAVCGGLIGAGGFGWLDAALKVLMAVMAVSTLVAAAIALPGLVERGGLDAGSLVPSIPEDPAARAALIAFAVALAGWMPAPLDISVWHSLWTLARENQTRHAPSKREAELDFGVGYALCVLLAVGFLVLGAAEMHGTGIEPAASGGAFATQLIDLYTASFGGWVRPIIAACAIAVMFSTTLTVLDALPRTAVVIVRRFGSDERRQGAAGPGRELCRTAGYWAALVVIAGGAVWIIGRVRGEGFRGLIDLATTLSFLGTPLLAYFNHRAMVGAEIGEADRPGRWMRVWSWAGIVFWAGFAGVFLWSRFGG